MKKFLCLTISLGVTLTSLAFGGATASADEVSSGYPTSFVEKFEPTGFKDYAIGEKSAAFAIEDEIWVFKNDDEGWQGAVCDREVYKLDGSVSALDCVNGEFIYTLDGNTVYTLDGEVSEKQITPPINIYYDEKYTYDIIQGDLQVSDRHVTSQLKVIDGNFDKFKYYGALYVTDDGWLKVVKSEDATAVSEVEATAIEYIQYINFAPADKIEIDSNTTESFKTVSEGLEFFTIKPGFYATQIDLSDISGENFKAIETKTTDEINKNAVALKLYGRDGLTIVAIGDEAYALHPGALEKYTPPLVETLVGKAESIAADSCNPYSLPFISDATKRSKELSGGMEVWIIKKVSSNWLEHDFYLISYVDNQEEYIGYVPTEYIPGHFNENPPENIPDPDPNTDDSVRTVVLILVVVVLVMGAVGYLTWVSTSGKKRPAKKKDSDDNK